MTCSFLWPNLTEASHPATLTVVIITLITMLLSAPGNVITGYVILINRKLRTEATYLLICSVCVADIIVSCVAQPLFVATIILGPRESCVLDNIFFASAWLSSVASTFGIIGITLNRYIYIIHPLHYENYMTVARAKIMIIGVWITSILCSLIPLMYHNSLVLSSFVLIIFLTMVLVMVIAYKKVYTAIKGSLTTIKKLRSFRRRKINQYQATFSLFLIVATFCGCWAPWVILHFVVSFHEHAPFLKAFQPSSIYLQLYWIALGLGYLNSLINVYLYSRKNAVLRMAIFRFLGLKKKMRRSKTLPTTYEKDRAMFAAISDMKQNALKPKKENYPAHVVLVSAVNATTILDRYNQ